MADIQGSYDDLFTAVPNALAGLLDDGDAGGSVAVFVDGEPVVDIWGGFTDADRTIRWRRDTIANVFSVTKTMTALCALVLADRGDLDLDASVARYWPEFAAAGKDTVLVRHLLAHTAGLPDWDGADRGALRLAVRHGPSGRAASAVGTGNRSRVPLPHAGVPRGRGPTPDHRPKRRRILRAGVGRTAGRRLSHRLPAEHDQRVALAVPPSSQGEDYAASAPGSTTAAAGTEVRVRDGNSLAWRRAQIPAASGFGNARSVALVQSVMACGGAVRGVRLLSQAGCDRARKEQFSGEDRRLEMPVRWGLGYGLFGAAFGWGGWGGSLVMIDPGNRMTVAYVTNQMREPANDTRGLELVMATYDGLTGLRA